MSEVGGGQGSSPWSEHTMVLDVSLLHETRILKDDPGPTQVIEPVVKKQKACDVNEELADDAAEKAVSKMLQRLQADNDRREENLFSGLQDSLKSVAEDAVGQLSGELHHNLKNWETKLEDKMQTHLNDHRSHFEKSGRTRLCNSNQDPRTVSSRWLNFALDRGAKNRGQELEESDGE